MPNRVIRESLLDSERYWAVTIEARQLFFHLLLLADDLGCVSLAPVFLRRRCFDGAPAQAKIDLLITQLLDVDLVRIYEVEGARYAFIPRYRQRLKRITSKYPKPPAETLHGDSDAQEKFKLIKTKTENAAADRQPEDDSPAPEEKRREEKKSILTDAEGVPPCPHVRILELYAKHLPTATRVNHKLWNGTRAQRLQARWREDKDRQSPSWWEEFFAYCAKSSFLTGKVSTPGREPFMVSLDWLLKPANFVKVHEGFYHRDQVDA